MIKGSVLSLPSQVHNVISQLNAAAINYAILRPSSPDSSRYQELDILVDPDHRDQFVKLCETYGFYEGRPNPTRLLKAVYYRYENRLLMAFDVHFSVVSKGLVYLDYRLLLERRVFREGGYYLSLEDQLLHFAFHCILDKCDVPLKYSEYFDLYLCENYDEAYIKAHLEKFGLYLHFKTFLASRHVLQENPSQCGELSNLVRQTLKSRHPQNFMRYVWRRVCHRFLQIAGTRGVLIAIVGPDGVGKSTLTSRLQKQVKELRQSSTCVYMGPWGQSILPVSKFVRLLGTPGTPSQRLRVPLIPQLRWFFYLLILTVEFLTRHVVRVIPARRNYPVVFSDRYFYDVGVGYKKHAIGQCQRLRQLFCRLLFHPDLTIFLLAKPRTVTSRKDELNELEAAEFNRAYHAIAQQLDIVIVESDEQSDKVVDRVLEDIWPLLFCSRRISKQRMNLLVETSKKQYSKLSTWFHDIDIAGSNGPIKRSDSKKS